jgi:uncharacterized membrane protein
MTLSGRSAVILMIVLGLSVFLNLAAAGFIGVVVSSAGAGILRGQQTGPLPPELRQVFRAELVANRRPVLAALGELRRDRDALHAALTAPTLDPAAVEALNVAIREDVETLLDLGQTILVSAISKLPDDIRQNIPPLNAGDQLLQNLSGRERSDLRQFLRDGG